jgi:hypothetical protein
MRTGGAAGAHRGVGGEIVVGRGGELLPARRQPVRGMRELVETCLLMHVRARRSTSTRTHAVRARAAGTAAETRGWSRGSRGCARERDTGCAACVGYSLLQRRRAAQQRRAIQAALQARAACACAGLAASGTDCVRCELVHACMHAHTHTHTQTHTHTHTHTSSEHEMSESWSATAPLPTNRRTICRARARAHTHTQTHTHTNTQTHTHTHTRTVRAYQLILNSP